MNEKGEKIIRNKSKREKKEHKVEMEHVLNNHGSYTWKYWITIVYTEKWIKLMNDEVSFHKRISHSA